MTTMVTAVKDETLRRYRPYPAYKDSGVEWLGDIPAHWDVKRLKYVAPLRITKLDIKPDDAVYVGLENVESWTGRLLLESQPESVDSIVGAFRAGDVLFGKLRPYLAKVARPDFDGVCTSEILSLRPAAGCTQSYVMYGLLNAPYIRWLDSFTYGTKMPRLSPSQVAGSFVSQPPLEEQRAIANFLNHETARIDALVAKKQRLIELLQEQRAGLITRAVTKGLDPSVPMKDSGVEWLDQYPKHWNGLPLKRWVGVKITDGPHETPELLPNGVDFISAEAVNEGRINFERRRGFISSELHAIYCRKCRPARDDILMCKSGATTGKLARVDVDFEFSVWSPLAMIRACKSRIMPAFLEMALQSDYVQHQIRRTWSAGTQPNISMGDLEQLFVVAPPLGEQAAILDCLGRTIGGFGVLIGRVKEAIERLNELRTAVISAAVTGKIDVRQEVT